MPMTGLDRRFLPALAAILVLAIVLLVHTLVFEPLAARYHRQLAQSGEIAASLDPSLAASPIPMPVQDLLMDNSVEASDAARLAESGELATDLVKRIADASRSGRARGSPSPPRDRVADRGHARGARPCPAARGLRSGDHAARRTRARRLPLSPGSLQPSRAAIAGDSRASSGSRG
jgi:hypothetical protein